MSRPPLPIEQVQRYVELLPELGWNFTGAYAQITGMNPGHHNTRKAAGAFGSHPYVAMMVRRRWGVARDSKISEREAQEAYRQLVWLDPGDFLTIDETTGQGRYLTVAEFKALPAAVRRCVQSFELLTIGGFPQDRVRVTLPNRLEALKAFCAISGLGGGELEKTAAQLAGTMVGNFVAAAARARELTAESLKSRTAKQLVIPHMGETYEHEASKRDDH